MGAFRTGHSQCIGDGRRTNKTTMTGLGSDLNNILTAFSLRYPKSAAK
ncbi:hypothetical protein ACVXHB_20230 [Escherichia coli]